MNLLKFGRVSWSCPVLRGVGVLLGLSVATVQAAPVLTLHELENDPKMTPGRFADLFENFTFQYQPYVQNPDVFLRTEAGDCADYAIMADYILRRRGYHTRIVHVSMVGTDIAHVVCYVRENRVYLDYNTRSYFFNLTHSGPTLREIADKVAASFERNWTWAAEYTYNYQEDKKHVIMTVVKTDDPSRDPDRQSPQP